MSKLTGLAQEKVETISKQYGISLEDAKGYYLARKEAKLNGRHKPSFKIWKDSNTNSDQHVKEVFEKVIEDHKETLERLSDDDLYDSASCFEVAESVEPIEEELEEVVVTYNMSDLNKIKKVELVELLQSLGGESGRKTKAALVLDILSLQE